MVDEDSHGESEKLNPNQLLSHKVHDLGRFSMGYVADILKDAGEVAVDNPGESVRQPQSQSQSRLLRHKVSISIPHSIVL